VRSLIR